MATVRLELREGELFWIRGVPLVVAYARGKRCVLVSPQYEVLDGAEWPMAEPAELIRRVQEIQQAIDRKRDQQQNRD